MEKLFKAFSTTKARGMGMGLAICKKFVEGHGGSINVESEVGRGTTFKIRLPIRRGNGGEDD
jgi:signal transduction histidine kinase